VFEHYFPERPTTYKADIAAELARLGDAVPDDVECAYHLCYGSPHDEHLIMPRDAAIMVEITRGLLARLRRQVDCLHLPVPKDRTDDGYFALLAELSLAPESTLYLGLIHHADADGDRGRMAAAHRVVPSFGVASECGWGRTDPARVPDLLAAHRQAVTGAAR